MRVNLGYSNLYWINKDRKRLERQQREREETLEISEETPQEVVEEEVVDILIGAEPIMIGAEAPPTPPQSEHQLMIIRRVENGS